MEQRKEQMQRLSADAEAIQLLTSALASGNQLGQGLERAASSSKDLATLLEGVSAALSGNETNMSQQCARDYVHVLQQAIESWSAPAEAPQPEPEEDGLGEPGLYSAAHILRLWESIIHSTPSLTAHEGAKFVVQGSRGPATVASLTDAHGKLLHQCAVWTNAPDLRLVSRLGLCVIEGDEALESTLAAAVKLMIDDCGVEVAAAAAQQAAIEKLGSGCVRRVIIAYHVSQGHWVLGVLDMARKVEAGVEETKSQEQKEQREEKEEQNEQVEELWEGKLKFLDPANSFTKVPTKLVVPGLHQIQVQHKRQLATQQHDLCSSGPIVAENGAAFFSAGKGVLKPALKKSYPWGAHELRAKQAEQCALPADTAATVDNASAQRDMYYAYAALQSLAQSVDCGDNLKSWMAAKGHAAQVGDALSFGGQADKDMAAAVHAELTRRSGLSASTESDEGSELTKLLFSRSVSDGAVVWNKARLQYLSLNDFPRLAVAEQAIKSERLADLHRRYRTAAEALSTLKTQLDEDVAAAQMKQKQSVGDKLKDLQKQKQQASASHIKADEEAKLLERRRVRLAELLRDASTSASGFAAQVEQAVKNFDSLLDDVEKKLQDRAQANKTSLQQQSAEQRAAAVEAKLHVVEDLLRQLDEDIAAHEALRAKHVAVIERLKEELPGLEAASANAQAKVDNRTRELSDLERASRVLGCSLRAAESLCKPVQVSSRASLIAELRAPGTVAESELRSMDAAHENYFNQSAEVDRQEAEEKKHRKSKAFCEAALDKSRRSHPSNPGYSQRDYGCINAGVRFYWPWFRWLCNNCDKDGSSCSDRAKDKKLRQERYKREMRKISSKEAGLETEITSYQALIDRATSAKKSAQTQRDKEKLALEKAAETARQTVLAQVEKTNEDTFSAKADILRLEASAQAARNEVQRNSNSRDEKRAEAQAEANRIKSIKTQRATVQQRAAELGRGAEGSAAVSGQFVSTPESPGSGSDPSASLGPSEAEHNACEGLKRQIEELDNEIAEHEKNKARLTAQLQVIGRELGQVEAEIKSRAAMNPAERDAAENERMEQVAQRVAALRDNYLRRVGSTLLANGLVARGAPRVEGASAVQTLAKALLVAVHGWGDGLDLLEEPLPSAVQLPSLLQLASPTDTDAQAFVAGLHAVERQLPPSLREEADEKKEEQDDQDDTPEGVYTKGGDPSVRFALCRDVDGRLCFRFPLTDQTALQPIVLDAGGGFQVKWTGQSWDPPRFTFDPTDGALVENGTYRFYSVPLGTYVKTDGAVTFTVLGREDGVICFQHGDSGPLQPLEFDATGAFAVNSTWKGSNKDSPQFKWDPWDGALVQHGTHRFYPAGEDGITTTATGADVAPSKAAAVEQVDDGTLSIVASAVERVYQADLRDRGRKGRLPCHLLSTICEANKAPDDLDEVLVVHEIDSNFVILDDIQPILEGQRGDSAAIDLLDGVVSSLLTANSKRALALSAMEMQLLDGRAVSNCEMEEMTAFVSTAAAALPQQCTLDDLAEFVSPDTKGDGGRGCFEQLLRMLRDVYKKIGPNAHRHQGATRIFESVGLLREAVLGGIRAVVQGELQRRARAFDSQDTGSSALSEIEAIDGDIDKQTKLLEEKERRLKEIEKEHTEKQEALRVISDKSKERIAALQPKIDELAKLIEAKSAEVDHLKATAEAASESADATVEDVTKASQQYQELRDKHAKLQEVRGEALAAVAEAENEETIAEAAKKAAKQECDEVEQMLQQKTQQLDGLQDWAQFVAEVHTALTTDSAVVARRQWLRQKFKLTEPGVDVLALLLSCKELINEGRDHAKPDQVQQWHRATMESSSDMRIEGNIPLGVYTKADKGVKFSICRRESDKRTCFLYPIDGDDSTLQPVEVEEDGSFKVQWRGEDWGSPRFRLDPEDGALVENDTYRFYKPAAQSVNQAEGELSPEQALDAFKLVDLFRVVENALLLTIDRDASDDSAMIVKAASLAYSEVKAELSAYVARRLELVGLSFDETGCLHIKAPDNFRWPAVKRSSVALHDAMQQRMKIFYQHKNKTIPKTAEWAELELEGDKLAEAIQNMNEADASKHALREADVLRCFAGRIKLVTTHNIVIDDNLSLPGIGLVLYSLHGTAAFHKGVSLDTAGVASPGLKHSTAHNASEYGESSSAGRDGDAGIYGQAGMNGGQVLVHANELSGLDNITIIDSSGAVGEVAQKGGAGGKGADGTQGRSAKPTPISGFTSAQYRLAEAPYPGLSGDKNEQDPNKANELSGKGGDGGQSGLSGESGLAGRVTFIDSSGVVFKKLAGEEDAEDKPPEVCKATAKHLAAIVVSSRPKHPEHPTNKAEPGKAGEAGWAGPMYQLQKKGFLWGLFNDTIGQSGKYWLWMKENEGLQNPSVADIVTVTAIMMAGWFMMLCNPVWAVAAGVIAAGGGYSTLIALAATTKRTDDKFSEEGEESFRRQIRISGSCPSAKEDKRDQAAIRKAHTHENSKGADGLMADKVIINRATRAKAQERGSELDSEESLLSLQQQAIGLASDKAIDEITQKYADQQAIMWERQGELEQKTRALAQQAREAATQHEQAKAKSEHTRSLLKNVSTRLNAAVAAMNAAAQAWDEGVDESMQQLQQALEASGLFDKASLEAEFLKIDRTTLSQTASEFQAVEERVRNAIQRSQGALDREEQRLSSAAETLRRKIKQLNKQREALALQAQQNRADRERLEREQQGLASLDQLLSETSTVEATAELTVEVEVDATESFADLLSDNHDNDEDGGALVRVFFDAKRMHWKHGTVVGTEFCLHHIQLALDGEKSILGILGSPVDKHMGYIRDLIKSARGLDGAKAHATLDTLELVVRYAPTNRAVLKLVKPQGLSRKPDLTAVLHRFWDEWWPTIKEDLSFHHRLAREQEELQQADSSRRRAVLALKRVGLHVTYAGVAGEGEPITELSERLVNLRAHLREGRDKLLTAVLAAAQSYEQGVENAGKGAGGALALLLGNAVEFQRDILRVLEVWSRDHSQLELQAKAATVRKIVKIVKRLDCLAATSVATALDVRAGRLIARVESRDTSDASLNITRRSMTLEDLFRARSRLAQALDSSSDAVVEALTRMTRITTAFKASETKDPRWEELLVADIWSRVASCQAEGLPTAIAAWGAAATEQYLRSFERSLPDSPLQIARQVLRLREEATGIGVDEVLRRKAAFFSQLRAYTTVCSQPHAVCEVLRNTTKPCPRKSVEYGREREVVLSVYDEKTVLKPSPHSLHSLLPPGITLQSASYEQLHELFAFVLADRSTRLAQVEAGEGKLTSSQRAAQRRIQALRKGYTKSEQKNLVSLALDFETDLYSKLSLMSCLSLKSLRSIVDEVYSCAALVNGVDEAQFPADEDHAVSALECTLVPRQDEDLVGMWEEVHFMDISAEQRKAVADVIADALLKRKPSVWEFLFKPGSLEKLSNIAFKKLKAAVATLYMGCGSKFKDLVSMLPSAAAKSLQARLDTTRSFLDQVVASDVLHYQQGDEALGAKLKAAVDQAAFFDNARKDAEFELGETDSRMSRSVVERCRSLVAHRLTARLLALCMRQLGGEHATTPTAAEDWDSLPQGGTLENMNKADAGADPVPDADVNADADADAGAGASADADAKANSKSALSFWTAYAEETGRLVVPRADIEKALLSCTEPISAKPPTARSVNTLLWLLEVWIAIPGITDKTFEIYSSLCTVAASLRADSAWISKAPASRQKQHVALVSVLGDAVRSLGGILWGRIRDRKSAKLHREQHKYDAQIKAVATLPLQNVPNSPLRVRQETFFEYALQRLNNSRRLGRVSVEVFTAFLAKATPPKAVPEKSEEVKEEAEDTDDYGVAPASAAQLLEKQLVDAVNKHDLASFAESLKGVETSNLRADMQNIYTQLCTATDVKVAMQTLVIGRESDATTSLLRCAMDMLFVSNVKEWGTNTEKQDQGAFSAAARVFRRLAEVLTEKGPVLLSEGEALGKVRSQVDLWITAVSSDKNAVPEHAVSLGEAVSNAVEVLQKGCYRDRQWRQSEALASGLQTGESATTNTTAALAARAAFVSLHLKKLRILDALLPSDDHTSREAAFLGQIGACEALKDPWPFTQNALEATVHGPHATCVASVVSAVVDAREQSFEQLHVFAEVLCTGDEGNDAEIDLLQKLFTQKASKNGTMGVMLDVLRGYALRQSNKERPLTDAERDFAARGEISLGNTTAAEILSVRLALNRCASMQSAGFTVREALSAWRAVWSKNHCIALDKTYRGDAAGIAGTDSDARLKSHLRSVLGELIGVSAAGGNEPARAVWSLGLNAAKIRKASRCLRLLGCEKLVNSVLLAQNEKQEDLLAESKRRLRDLQATHGDNWGAKQSDTRLALAHVELGLNLSKWLAARCGGTSPGAIGQGRALANVMGSADVFWRLADLADICFKTATESPAALFHPKKGLVMDADLFSLLQLLVSPDLCNLTTADSLLGRYLEGQTHQPATKSLRALLRRHEHVWLHHSDDIDVEQVLLARDPAPAGYDKSSQSRRFLAQPLWEDALREAALRQTGALLITVPGLKALKQSAASLLPKGKWSDAALEHLDAANESLNAALTSSDMTSLGSFHFAALQKLRLATAEAAGAVQAERLCNATEEQLKLARNVHESLVAMGSTIKRVEQASAFGALVSFFRTTKLPLLSMSHLLYMAREEGVVETVTVVVDSAKESKAQDIVWETYSHFVRASFEQMSHGASGQERQGQEQLEEALKELLQLAGQLPEGVLFAKMLHCSLLKYRAVQELQLRPSLMRDIVQLCIRTGVYTGRYPDISRKLLNVSFAAWRTVLRGLAASQRLGTKADTEVEQHLRVFERRFGEMSAELLLTMLAELSLTVADTRTFVQHLANGRWQFDHDDASPLVVTLDRNEAANAPLSLLSKLMRRLSGVSESQLQFTHRHLTIMAGAPSLENSDARKLGDLLGSDRQSPCVTLQMPGLAVRYVKARPGSHVAVEAGLSHEGPDAVLHKGSYDDPQAEAAEPIVALGGHHQGESDFAWLREFYEDRRRNRSGRRQVRRLLQLMSQDSSNSSVAHFFEPEPTTGLTQLEYRLKLAKDFYTAKGHWDMKAAGTMDESELLAAAKAFRAKGQEGKFEVVDWCWLAAMLARGLNRLKRDWKVDQGCIPIRDVQLMAFFIFVDSFERGGRLGNVKTGEGKSLITQMLCIARVMEGKTVDCITSNRVLAERDAKEAKPLLSLFGITVANNCDTEAEQDEDKRKARYANQVVFGDTGSFQRDLLLTQFFNKNIRASVAGALIVDEVDSMFIDSAANTLYISHKIDDLRYLDSVFVLIWTAVATGADTQQYNERSVELVERLVLSKLAGEDGDCVVPAQLTAFVKARLRTWIRSAYTAKLMDPNEQYTIIKGGAKNGTATVMDLSTGVEQLSTHWSNGLHQFIQLKHLNKLTPISLKAVFVSNMGFFSLYNTNIVGMTGTVGSSVEVGLMHHIYQVDTFRLPRRQEERYYEQPAKVEFTQPHWLQALRKEVVGVATGADKSMTAEKTESVEKAAQEALSELDQVHKDKDELAKDRDRLQAAESAARTAASRCTDLADEMQYLVETPRGSSKRGLIDHALSFLPRAVECAALVAADLECAKQAKSLRSKSDSIQKLLAEAADDKIDDAVGGDTQLTTEVQLQLIAQTAKVKQLQEEGRANAVKLLQRCGVLVIQRANTHDKEAEVAAEEIASLDKELSKKIERIQDLDDTSTGCTGRAVLAICPDQRVVKLVTDTLLKHIPSVYRYQGTLQGISKLTNSGVEESKLKPADIRARPGTVIVATNIAGRGTDFKTSDLCEANGGLHVVLAYVPDNQRVESQAWGRTARSGNAGTGRFVVLAEDCDGATTVAQMIEQRDEKEAERLEVIREKTLPKLVAESKLLKRFEALSKQMHTTAPKYIQGDNAKTWEELQTKSFQDHWAMWLDGQSAELDKVHEDAKERTLALLAAADDWFKTLQLKAAARNEGYICSTGERLKLVALYMQCEEWERARKMCESIITEDPHFSASAHLYKSLSCIGESPGSKTSPKKHLDQAIALLQQESTKLHNQIIVVENAQQILYGGKVGQVTLFQQSHGNNAMLLGKHIDAAQAARGKSLAASDLRVGDFAAEDKAEELYNKLLSQDFIKGERVTKKLCVRFHVTKPSQQLRRELTAKKECASLPDGSILAPLTAEQLRRATQQNDGVAPLRAAALPNMMTGKLENVVLPPKFHYVQNEIWKKVEAAQTQRTSASLEAVYSAVLTSEQVLQALAPLTGSTQGYCFSEDYDKDKVGVWVEDALKERKGLKHVLNALKDRQGDFFCHADLLQLCRARFPQDCFKKPEQDDESAQSQAVAKVLDALIAKKLVAPSKRYKLSSSCCDLITAYQTTLTYIDADKLSALDLTSFAHMVPFREKILKLCQDGRPITRATPDPAAVIQELETTGAVERLNAIRVAGDADYNLVSEALSDVSAAADKDDLTRLFAAAAEDKSAVRLNDNNKLEQAAYHLIAAGVAVPVYKVKDAAALAQLQAHEVGCSNLKELADATQITERDVHVYERNLQTLSGGVLNEQDFDTLRALVGVPLCDILCFDAAVHVAFRPIMAHEMVLESILLALHADKRAGFAKSDVEAQVPGRDELRAVLMAEKVLKAPYVRFKLAESDPESKLEVMKEKVKKCMKTWVGQLLPALPEVKKTKYRWKGKRRRRRREKYTVMVADKDGEKARLEKCQNDVISVLTAAIGQLRLHKELEPKGTRMNAHFLPGVSTPDELFEFESRCTDMLVSFQEKTTWWPKWSQIVVAIVGLAQIVAGALLICCSGGVGAHLGAMLISEGVSDLMMALQAYLTGEKITWASYARDKAISVAMTVACVGVGAYLARGAKAAKITEGLAKNERLWILGAAVGKKIAASLGEAALGAAMSFAADKSAKKMTDMIFNQFKQNFRGWVKGSPAFKNREVRLHKAIRAAYEKFGKDGEQYVQAALEESIQAMQASVAKEVQGKVLEASSIMSEHLSLASERLKYAKRGRAARLAAGARIFANVAQMGTVLKSLKDIVVTVPMLMDDTISRLAKKNETLERSKSATAVADLDKQTDAKLGGPGGVADQMLEHIKIQVETTIMQSHVQKLIQHGAQSVMTKVGNLGGDLDALRDRAAGQGQLQRMYDDPKNSLEQGLKFQQKKQYIMDEIGLPDAQGKRKYPSPIIDMPDDPNLVVSYNGQLTTWGQVKSRDMESDVGMKLFHGKNGVLHMVRPDYSTYVNAGFSPDKRTNLLGLNAMALTSGVEVVVRNERGEVEARVGAPQNGRKPMEMVLLKDEAHPLGHFVPVEPGTTTPMQGAQEVAGVGKACAAQAMLYWEAVNIHGMSPEQAKAHAGQKDAVESYLSQVKQVAASSPNLKQMYYGRVHNINEGIVGGVRDGDRDGAEIRRPDRAEARRADDLDDVTPMPRTHEVWQEYVGKAEYWERYEKMYDRWHKGQVIKEAVSTVSTTVGFSLAAASVVATDGAALVVIIPAQMVSAAAKTTDRWISSNLHQAQRDGPEALATLLRSKNWWSSRFAAAGLVGAVTGNVSVESGLEATYESLDQMSTALGASSDAAGAISTSQFVKFLEEEMCGPNYRQVMQWDKRSTLQMAGNLIGGRFAISEPTDATRSQKNWDAERVATAAAARQLKKHLHIDINPEAPAALKLIDTSIVAVMQECRGLGQYVDAPAGDEQRWIGARLMEGDRATMEYLKMVTIRRLPGQRPRDRPSDGGLLLRPEHVGAGDQVFVLRPADREEAPLSMPPIPQESRPPLIRSIPSFSSLVPPPPMPNKMSL
jgi:preprotein translocase subunit SecA/chromosome segregation ATPase